MQTGKDISGTARLTRYTAFSDLFTSCTGQEFSLVAMTSTTVSAYGICGGDSAFSTVGTATAYSWLGFPFEYFGLSAWTSLLSDDFDYGSSGGLRKLVKTLNGTSSQLSDNFVFLTLKSAIWSNLTILFGILVLDFTDHLEVWPVICTSLYCIIFPQYPIVISSIWLLHF